MGLSSSLSAPHPCALCGPLHKHPSCGHGAEVGTCIQLPSTALTRMADAQRVKGHALRKPQVSPAPGRLRWATRSPHTLHILALPPLARSPFYFVCFPKEHPPDSLPGVIDAGGGGFSQPLAFALASPGGAVVAAVSGTPAGAVRACAGCAARCRARFCKQSGATSQSNNWGNVFCQFPPISQQASFISTCNEDEPIPEVSIKRPGAGTAGAAASLAP